MTGSPIPSYRPDKFADVYQRYDGARVWGWLHSPDILIRLETACALRRPAVEALSIPLKTAFPDLVDTLKFRQLVGHMVRQVLEEQGYGLKRANVRTRQKGCVYGYGSVYNLPGFAA